MRRVINNNNNNNNSDHENDSVVDAEPVMESLSQKTPQREPSTVNTTTGPPMSPSPVKRVAGKNLDDQ